MLGHIVRKQEEAPAFLQELEFAVTEMENLERIDRPGIYSLEDFSTIQRAKIQRENMMLEVQRENMMLESWMPPKVQTYIRSGTRWDATHT